MQGAIPAQAMVRDVTVNGNDVFQVREVPRPCVGFGTVCVDPFV